MVQCLTASLKSRIGCTATLAPQLFLTDRLKYALYLGLGDLMFLMLPASPPNKLILFRFLKRPSLTLKPV